MKWEIKKMQYSHIFFDLDGTLTQSEFGIIRSARHALSKFGIEEPDRNKLLRFIGPPLYYSFDKYYGISGSKCDEAVRYFQEYYDTDAYNEAPVFEGITDLLDELSSQGRTLLVVTSKPQNMADKVIEHTGLLKYFPLIVGPGAEMTDPSKANLIRKAIGLTGADTASVIMIGDRHYDIEGAVEVGVDSIGALYGYGTRPELEKAGATYIADTPSDILKILAM